MQDNPYNRMIRNQLDEITRKYLQNTENSGKLVLNEDMEIPAVKPLTQYVQKDLKDFDEKLEGNSKIGKRGAQKLHNDNEKINDAKEKIIKKIIKETKDSKGTKKAGIIKTAPIPELPAIKKRGRGRPIGSVSKPVVSGNIDKMEDTTLIQKSAGAKKTGKGIARAVGSGKSEMEGAGFFDTLESIAPLAMLALGKTKKGKTKKAKKGGSVGVDAMAEQANLLTGNGKKRGRKPKSGAGWFDDVVNSVGNIVKTAVDVGPSAIALSKMMKKN